MKSSLLSICHFGILLFSILILGIRTKRFVINEEYSLRNSAKYSGVPCNRTDINYLQTFLEQIKSRFIRNYQMLNPLKITSTVGLNGKSIGKCLNGKDEDIRVTLFPIDFILYIRIGSLI